MAVDVFGNGHFTTVSLPWRDCGDVWVLACFRGSKGSTVGMLRMNDVVCADRRIVG
jgi:hypothetical protein